MSEYFPQLEKSSNTGLVQSWYIAVPCLSVIWVLRKGDQHMNLNKYIYIFIYTEIKDLNTGLNNL